MHSTDWLRLFADGINQLHIPTLVSFRSTVTEDITYKFCIAMARRPRSYATNLAPSGFVDLQALHYVNHCDDYRSISSKRKQLSTIQPMTI